MKYFSYIFVGALLILLSYQGCRKADSFLDKKVDASLNEDNVFSDSARTMDYLAGIYEGLYFWINTNTPNARYGPWYEMTDIASTRWPGGHNIANQVFNGTFGEPFYNKIETLWSHFYTRIRQCNIYLKHVVPGKSPLSDRLIKRTRAEARFLRAYHYFMLMKGWGGVPLVGDTVYNLSSKGNAPRATFKACVDYVVNELDEIVPMLPLKYSGRNYGRITRGACLALKAKVLLFAASALFNGGSIANNEKLAKFTAYPTYDADRWQRALEATQDVIDLGIYHLETDNQTKPGYGFYKVFLERVNPEYILAWMDGPNRNAEEHVLPRSLGGDFRRYPTQELVDAFPMKNGLPITDPNSGYDPDNPYKNRAPRFYYSVIYNGALYFDVRSHKMEPIWTYVGATPDGLKPVTTNSGTNTGYYVRKMCDVLVNGRSSSARTDRCLPVIRYGGILLDLAEAANETGNITLAMEQLIKLRKRAGIEPGTDQRYGLPADPSKDEARKLIRRERMIELSFEGHRFWDLRRWKAGNLLDGKFMHGMRITKNGNSFTYKRIKTRKRYFKPNLYLFPLPHSEIANDTALIQNPGW